MWNKLRSGQRGAAAAAPVAETSRAHEQALAVLWWRWRHLYLAARRLQLDKERQTGGPS
ncbi:MAG TPA: hypothetical protein VFS21_01370 [Roseiflexaceae bacterium]|nr:hypothetical protein [Roseiflexaceae bacterium]